MADDSPLAIEHLTRIELDAPTFVRAAAAAGYRLLSLRVRTPDAEAETDPWSMPPQSGVLRETRTILDAEGAGVLGVEVFPLAEGTDVAEFAPYVESAALLGATTLNVVVFDPDMSRAVDNLAALAALAAPFALEPQLEPLPYSTVRTPTEAWELARSASPACGVQIDTLHFHRAGADLAEVVAIPRSARAYLQLCGVTTRSPSSPYQLRHEARTDRLLPASSEADVESLIRLYLDPLMISVEVPNSRIPATLTDSIPYLGGLRRSTLDLIEKVLAPTKRTLS